MPENNTIYSKVLRRLSIAIRKNIDIGYENHLSKALKNIVPAPAISENAINIALSKFRSDTLVRLTSEAYIEKNIQDTFNDQSKDSEGEIKYRSFEEQILHTNMKDISAALIAWEDIIVENTETFDELLEEFLKDVHVTKDNLSDRLTDTFDNLVSQFLSNVPFAL